MTRTGKTYLLINLFLAIALVISACGDVGTGFANQESRLCLGATDCSPGEVCGPSGECVSEPGFLKRRRGDEPTSDEERQLMSVWEQWGTLGSRSGQPISDENHSFCTIADVRSSDLQRGYDESYPVGYWGDEPVAASEGVCGDDMETLAWRLMNCERMSYGLEPLACDQRLVWLGRQHSGDMAARAFFDHVNPDSRDPFDRMDGRGIEFEIAGENLARFETVEAAHAAWMNSEVHRRTLLTPQFSRAGIGVVRSAGQLLIAQELTRPLSSVSTTMPKF